MIQNNLRFNQEVYHMLKQKLPRQLEDLLKAGDIQEAKKLFS